jgi:hypothetical protein
MPAPLAAMATPTPGADIAPGPSATSIALVRLVVAAVMVWRTFFCAFASASLRLRLLEPASPFTVGTVPDLDAAALWRLRLRSAPPPTGTQPGKSDICFSSWEAKWSKRCWPELDLAALVGSLVSTLVCETMSISSLGATVVSGTAAPST